MHARDRVGAARPACQMTGSSVTPPTDGDFTSAHVVVTVTRPGGSETGWIECPLCCAAPVAVTRFKDKAYYDFDHFGRVAIPLAPAGFEEQWLAFPSDTDERCVAALHAFREEGTRSRVTSTGARGRTSVRRVRRQGPVGVRRRSEWRGAGRRVLGVGAPCRR